MRVFVNGELKEVAPNFTLHDCLQQFGPARNTFATALNNEFVSRDQYSFVKLNEGDQIEVVVAMQGG